MFVDAVAAKDRVSKPTLCLRYPSQATLATAPPAHVRERAAPRETCDTRADLVAQPRHFVAYIKTLKPASAARARSQRSHSDRIIRSAEQPAVRSARTDR
jgi:hypothetical protein